MEAMENIRIILAQNLKGRRKHLKINQEELAERSGLSTTYVKNIERGASWPSPESFEALSKGLGVTIGELLNEPSQPKARIMPASSVFKMALNVPDRIFELAGSLADPSSRAWKDVESVLEGAIEDIEEKKKSIRKA